MGINCGAGFFGFAHEKNPRDSQVVRGKVFNMGIPRRFLTTHLTKSSHFAFLQNFCCEETEMARAGGNYDHLIKLLLIGDSGMVFCKPFNHNSSSQSRVGTSHPVKCFLMLKFLTFRCLAGRSGKELSPSEIFRRCVHNEFYHNHWYRLQNSDHRHGRPKVKAPGGQLLVVFAAHNVHKCRNVSSLLGGPVAFYMKTQCKRLLGRFGTRRAKKGSEPSLLPTTAGRWAFFWFMTSLMSSRLITFATG